MNFVLALSIAVIVFLICAAVIAALDGRPSMALWNAIGGIAA